MGQKPEKRNGRYKFFIVAGLLVVVSALTCYFHLVFGIGAVFTHLFYIPVILASFWWRRKGVAVAVLLAVLLVFSRIFLGANVVTVNDYLRAVMFIVIGFVVAQLSRRIAQEHQQLEAVNQQLRASEQQLKAANQQLRADEQQLRAANQQLRADEQQLKAANQQLGATEQQLKAANQQLRAGEQQLKAANQQLRADEQQLRAANQQLRASEQQLRAEKEKAEKYFDVAATIMVVIGLDEKVVRINKKGCEILGYKRSRIIGRNWFDNFLPENIRQEAKKVFQQLISGKIKSAEYHRNPVLTKTGEERIIAWHNAILKDEQGKISGTLSSGSDITERKKTEDKLLDYQGQLKALASQLTLVEENERHRIATDLHATVAQSLVISKIKLDALRTSVPSRDIAKTLGEVCESLDETIQGTRSLTFDLSSPILYELGFEAAVAVWLVEQIQEKHNIKSEFEDDKQPKPLDDDVRVLLFRDVRELLINVVRHADAKKVKVSIRKVDGEIHVSVEDDGVGFEVAGIVSSSAQAGGFGLFSIRERLEQVGGHLEIESKPGRGTKVTLMAPLKQEKIAKG